MQNMRGVTCMPFTQDIILTLSKWNMSWTWRASTKVSNVAQFTVTSHGCHSVSVTLSVKENNKNINVLNYCLLVWGVHQCPMITDGWQVSNDCHQTSNISRTKFQNLDVSRLLSSSSLCPVHARCYVENEGVVGAAPTGVAPTTSEWSTTLFLTKVCFILEVWW